MTSTPSKALKVKNYEIHVVKKVIPVYEIYAKQSALKQIK